jgi:hypothetical protein
MNCKICNQKVDNIRKLSKHIRDQHKNTSVKQYYDEFLKKENEGFCVICQKPTNYAGLGEGYKKTCCQSCSGKLFRINLKKDKKRNDAFIDKVKMNMIKEWKKREKNGQKEEIIKKVTAKRKELTSKMTAKERKEKYGWLNKLPEEERKEKIKIMVQPMFDFWENASDEERLRVFKQRMITIIDRYGSEFPNHLIELSEETDKRLCEIFNVEYGKT